jgi:ankyrin repeat protein
MREKKNPKQIKSKKRKNDVKKDERFYELRNAAYYNTAEALKLIKQDPSIVSAKNSIGETAFHFLVVENELEAVEFLVQQGSDVNNQNDFGTPAIVEAAQLGYVEMVDLLMKLGAKVNIAEMIEEMEKMSVKEEKRNQIISVLQKHGHATEIT